MTTLFLAGVLAGYIISVPLGPVGVIIIRKTLNKGKWSGYVSGIGVTVADTFFAIIAGFGVSIITNFIQDYQVYIRIGGGFILCFLAYRIFTSNVVNQVRRKGKKGSLWTDFMHAYFLTLSNPLTIIAIGTIFAVGGPGKNALQQEILSLIAGVLLAASTWWFTLVTFVNLFRKKVRLKTLWYINKITGIVIFGFGIFVFLTVFVDTSVF